MPAIALAEQSTHNPKFDGLNQAADCTGGGGRAGRREKMQKNLT
jgi:hypothetical protein